MQNDIWKKERERKSRHREKWEINTSQLWIPKKSYKSPQIFGKAIREVLACLPIMLKKKKLVIAKLANMTLVDKASVVKKFD